MIQRVQSLLLLVVVLSCAALFFVPLATYSTELAYLKFFVKGMQHISPDPVSFFSPYLFILPLLLNIAIMAIALWAIYSYKNRIYQIKLSRIGLLLSILDVVVLFYYTSFIFEKKLLVQTEYEAGIYLPLVCLIMFYLAMRYIKKDEAKVKAADRLR